MSTETNRNRKHSRIPVACTRCRQRKIKCHPGPSGDPCGRCSKYGYDCHYISVAEELTTFGPTRVSSAACRLASRNISDNALATSSTSAGFPSGEAGVNWNNILCGCGGNPECQRCCNTATRSDPQPWIQREPWQSPQAEMIPRLGVEDSIISTSSSYHPMASNQRTAPHSQLPPSSASAYSTTDHHAGNIAYPYTDLVSSLTSAPDVSETQTTATSISAVWSPPDRHHDGYSRHNHQQNNMPYREIAPSLGTGAPNPEFTTGYFVAGGVPQYSSSLEHFGRVGVQKPLPPAATRAYSDLGYLLDDFSVPLVDGTESHPSYRDSADGGVYDPRHDKQQSPR